LGFNIHQGTSATKNRNTSQTQCSSWCSLRTSQKVHHRLNNSFL
jgi:hypothetical protein